MGSACGCRPYRYQRARSSARSGRARQSCRRPSVLSSGARHSGACGSPSRCQAGHVAHGEQPHREAPLLRRGVDLLRRAAFVDQEHRLLATSRSCVADEPVADTRHDRHFLIALPSFIVASTSLVFLSARLRAAASRSPARKVRADHVLRALRHCGDLVDTSVDVLEARMAPGFAIASSLGTCHLTSIRSVPLR